MKTTLVIEDTIADLLRQEAAKQKRTMSEIVESALRVFLHRKRARRDLPALPRFDGGEALVDVANRDALYRAMEGR